MPELIDKEKEQHSSGWEEEKGNESDDAQLIMFADD